MNTCPNCHFPDLNSLGIDDEDCAWYRCPQCGKEFADCYDVDALERDDAMPLVKQMDTKTATTCTFDDLLKR